MAQNDLYLLTIHYSVEQTEVGMSIGYRMDGGSYGVETGTAAASEFVVTKIPVLQAVLSSACQIDQVDFEPVTNPTELGGSAAIVDAPGLLGPNPLPGNMCGIVTIKTNAPNSKHNGRQFVSGMPEDGQNGGTLTGLQQGLLQDWADAIFVDIQPSAPEDADFAPVVISRFVNGVKRPTPVGYDFKQPVAKMETRQQQQRLGTRLGLS